MNLSRRSLIQCAAALAGGVAQALKFLDEGLVLAFEPGLGDLAAGPAAAATLLFRAVNLLLGTIVGWVVLLLAARRMKIHPTLGGLLKAVRGAEKVVEGEVPPKSPVDLLRE